jgi:hypothetical protein
MILTDKDALESWMAEVPLSGCEHLMERETSLKISAIKMPKITFKYFN